MKNPFERDVQYISSGIQGQFLKFFRRLSGSSFQVYRQVTKHGPTHFFYHRTKKKYILKTINQTKRITPAKPSINKTSHQQETFADHWNPFISHPANQKNKSADLISHLYKLSTHLPLESLSIIFIFITYHLIYHPLFSLANSNYIRKNISSIANETQKESIFDWQEVA